MKCPNCGEPIETRHSFCVICGADLKDFLESCKNSKAEKKTITKAARKRVRAVLTKRIRKLKYVKPKEQPSAAKPETASDEPETIIFPDRLGRSVP